MSLQVLALTILSVVLLSCGQSNTSRKASRQKETLSPSMMEMILSHQSLSCEDSTKCVEGIARIFAINFDDMNDSSMCTGFLVSSDVVMTNSHCAYAGKIDVKKTCEGLYFVFHNPGDWGQYYVAKCEKILWRDPNQSGRHTYKNGDNDFALIKLDQSIPLKPLSLDRLGIQRPTRNETIRVHPMVMDHQDPTNAKIMKLNCTVKMPTSRDELRQWVGFGVVELENCPVISGNSGSPVLDDRNNVVGVVFASSDPRSRTPGQPQGTKYSPTKGYVFSMDHINKVLGARF